MIENDGPEVVFRPIPLNDPLLFLKLPEQGGAGQWCEQRELCELHSGLLDEIERVPKDVQAIVVKAEDERSPDLNSGLVDAVNVVQVPVGPVYTLAGIADAPIGKTLKANEYSITTTLPGQPHQFLVAGEIDRDLGCPG